MYGTWYAQSVPLQLCLVFIINQARHSVHYNNTTLIIVAFVAFMTYVPLVEGCQVTGIVVSAEVATSQHIPDARVPCDGPQ